MQGSLYLFIDVDVWRSNTWHSDCNHDSMYLAMCVEDKKTMIEVCVCSYILYQSHTFERGQLHLSACLEL